MGICGLVAACLFLAKILDLTLGDEFGLLVLATKGFGVDENP